MAHLNDIDITTRIADAVSSTGLTVGEFAASAGRSPEWLKSILAEQRRATSLDIALIAQAAQDAHVTPVTSEWLLTGAPEPSIILCRMD